MHRLFGWRAVFVAVTLAGLLVIAGLWHARSSAPVDVRPVTLPATFMGLALKPDNFGITPSWTSMVRDELDGAPVAGASYGQIGVTAFVNVVAARTDLSGKLDLGLAGNGGRLIGNAWCTDYVVLRVAGTDDGKSAATLPRMDGKLLCWRTSDRLSVTAFVYSRPPATEDVAAAVDLIWTGLQ